MQMTRRDFLRSAAMSAALAAVAGPAGVARAAEANTPEKWVKGVCRYCGTGCGVLVGVKNGKAVAIKGDPNNHNQGFLCLKGALLIPVLNSPDRVTKPMIRRTKGGRLEPISWDEALDHMAKKFRTTIDTYGPDAVANARFVAASPRMAAALLALLEWGREHTSPTDANTPHALLVEAAAALDEAGGEEAAQ